MARLIALSLCLVTLLSDIKAFSEPTPGFDAQLTRLDQQRRVAISSDRARDAARISDEIGELYVTYQRHPGTGADNFMRAGALWTEAAHGTRLASAKETDYNAALLAFTKAKRGYEAAYAPKKSGIFKRQIAEAQQAIAALRAEMEAAGVPIHEPPPTGTPGPTAPPPEPEPVQVVVYTGASAEVAIDLRKQRFVIAVPTVFEIDEKLRTSLDRMRQPFMGDLGRAGGVMVSNYLVAAAINELDKDPRVDCASSPVKDLKHEKVMLGRVPACLISNVKVEHSGMTRSYAVVAMFLVHFQIDKTFYRLMVTATLETKDPATPRLVGAAEYIARSLRIADAPQPNDECTNGADERVAETRRKAALTDESSKVLFGVSKDNDDAVAAARGMAGFWKAGTAVMGGVMKLLPEAAGKSGIAVGFVMDYLVKGGEILDRISNTQWATDRAFKVTAELFVTTREVEATCETRRKCVDGKWVTSKHLTTAELGQGGHRAVRHANKGETEWGYVQYDRNQDFIDGAKVEAWSEKFLESELAKLATKRAEHEAWVGACR